jgi:pilus assembly protein Flp/PilA
MATIKMFWRLLKDESGATAIEYGLIAALISVAIFVGIGSAGGRLGGLWNDSAEVIQETLQR